MRDTKELIIYWDWIKTLPPERQPEFMMELLHQLIIELGNLRSELRDKQ